MRLINLSQNEVQKRKNNEKSKVLNSLIEEEEYVKIMNMVNFVKSFMAPLLFIVGNARKDPTDVQKMQDEVAFFKFAEDICRLSFKNQKNYPLLYVIRQLMHKAFLS